MSSSSLSPPVFDSYSLNQLALKTRLGEFSDTCFTLQISLLQVQLGALCILSWSFLSVTSFSPPSHLSADFQLAFINHDDRQCYHDHNHHRWHQVRWHPFKWVSQVSLLTHLTTRHQWDEHFHSARLVTHTHTLGSETSPAIRLSVSTSLYSL